MKATEKIYDKHGTLLRNGDLIDCEGATLETYWNEWYIDANSKDTIWKIEEFSLSNYKDGYMLVDFEKIGKK